MSLLHTLSYAALIAAFAFITLSLASGLLYISELIEEHSRLSKLVGQRAIYTIIALHAILYFSESLPLPQTLFSAICHVVYLQNFSSTWPLISLTSWSFIASCILVITDHFLWFFYFSRLTQEYRQTSHVRTYRPPVHARTPNIHGFADIATFFGLCVWLAPLFLFLSLSANDNALPTSSSGLVEPSTPTSSGRPPLVQSRSSLFKSLFDTLPRIHPRPKRRDTLEGLIAPRSPNPTRSRSPSPMRVPPSPSPMRVPPSPRFPPPSPGAPTPPRTYENDNILRLSPNFGLSSPPRGMRRATADGVGLRRIPSGADS